MTPEQQWQAAVLFSKQLNKMTTALDKGIIWADDRLKWSDYRIKTLEEEVARLTEEQYIHPLDGWAKTHDLYRLDDETDDSLRWRIYEKIASDTP